MQQSIESRVPVMRAEGLVLTVAGDDTLVYDQQSQALHTLNAVSNEIWQLCDGQQTINSIVATTGHSAEVVKRALGQLEDAKLLETPLADTQRSSESRRSFMKKAGIAAAAVPAIISVTAPLASANHSPNHCENYCGINVFAGTCFLGPNAPCGGNCIGEATWYETPYTPCSPDTIATDCAGLPFTYDLCLPPGGSGPAYCARRIYECRP